MKSIYARILISAGLLMAYAGDGFAQIVQQPCSLSNDTPTQYEADGCIENTNPSVYDGGFWASTHPGKVNLSEFDNIELPGPGGKVHVRGRSLQHIVDWKANYYAPVEKRFMRVWDMYSFTVEAEAPYQFQFRLNGMPLQSYFFRIIRAPEYLLNNPDTLHMLFGGNWNVIWNQFITQSSCTNSDDNFVQLTLSPGTYVCHLNGWQVLIDNQYSYINQLPQEEVVQIADSINAVIGNEHCNTLSGMYDIIIKRDGAPPTICEDASQIGVGPVFTTFEETGSTDPFVAGMPAQCTGPGNRPEKWYKFQPVTSNSYLRVWGNGDFDAAVEVYDACGGNLIKCQNEAGPGAREIVILPGLTIGATYYFRTYDVSATPATNQSFLVSSAHIPFVWLQNYHCGVTVTNSFQLVSTNPVTTFLLVGRMWRFTETTAPFNSYEHFVSGTNNRFLWSNFTQRQAGKSYIVEVKTQQYQGAHFGEYTNPCVVHYPGGIANPGGLTDSDGTLPSTDVLTVYPNPYAGGDLNVSIFTANPDAPVVGLDLLDMAGRLVLSHAMNQHVSEGTVRITPTAHLSQGIYFLRANKADGEYSIAKVVVR